MGEADSQVGRQLVEAAAEDEGEDRQVGLRGHAGQPLSHPSVKPRRFRQVPRVDEYRHADRGAVLQEGDDACVIEVAVADVVADLDAEVAVHLASLDLPACGVGVLEGYLSKGKEPLGCGGTDLEREIVEDATYLVSLDRIPPVAEEHRRRGDDLHIDAVGIHVCQPAFGIPAVGFDATKLARAEHDHRVMLGFDSQPRPLATCRHLIGRGEVWPAVRNVVGVNVDGEAHGPARR